MLNTLLPGLSDEMSVAICDAFCWFLPTIQALAPSATKARTCPEHIDPDPPVQKTTLFAIPLPSESLYISFLRGLCF